MHTENWNWILITNAIAAISALMSIIAFFRPELARLFRSFFFPFKLIVVEAGLIEVGLTSTGPQIGLLGTFISQNDESYIQSLVVKVRREKDNAEKNLEWFATKSPHLSGPYATVIQLPSVLKLLCDQTYQYNLVFVDNSTKKEFARLFRPAKQSIQQRIQTERKDKDGVGQSEQAKVELDSAINKIYADARNSDDYKEILDTFTKDFFWRAGKYRLQLTAKTMKPIATFVEEWIFYLSEVDEEQLRYNCIKAVEDGLGISNSTPYNLVVADYEDPVQTN